MLWGMAAACGRSARCRSCWSGIARGACTPAAAGRRRAMRRSAGSCRSAGTSASRADPQAKGAVERLQGYMETNFEPGRRFANHLDFQLQLDAWFQKANARTHKTLRARPVDRLARGAGGDATRCPSREPDLDRRWVTAGAARSARPVRHQRLLAGPEPGRPSRRGPCLPARDHRGRAGHGRARLPARAVLRQEPHDHRARARPGAREPARAEPERELVVEQRPLSVYDQLIA